MCQFLKKICATQVQQINFQKEREALAVMVKVFNKTQDQKLLAVIDSTIAELVKILNKTHDRKLLAVIDSTIAELVKIFNETNDQKLLAVIDSTNLALLEHDAEEKGGLWEEILSEGGSSLSGRKYSISCSEPNYSLPTTATRKRANTIGDMKADSTAPAPWCGLENFKSSKGFKVQPQAADEVPRPGIPESSTLRHPTPTHEKKL